MTVAPAARLITPSARTRVDRIGWTAVAEALDDMGVAATGSVLSAGHCRALGDLYDDDGRFRSTVDMARHRYGEGQYRYFAHPLPDLVAELRAAFWPHLLPIARDWTARTRRAAPWPDDLDDWLARCHDAGQTRPTPLLLRYGPGDWNALHRDLYGDLVFPLQVVIGLDEPGVDYTGGEFVVVEQQPHAGRATRAGPTRRASAATAYSPAVSKGLVMDVDSTTGGGRGWDRARFRRTLVVICAVAAVVRVGYVLGWRANVPIGLGDAYAYSAGADLLAGGRGFIEPLSVVNGHPWQGANHPPLYLLWLTVASVVDAGHHTSPTVHMVWSCVLGTGTVALCGLVGRRIAGARAGIVAAGIAAIYPGLWIHDGLLQSESIAMFMVALVLLCALRFLERPTGGRLAVLGAVCGLAALSRSELALLVPALLVPVGLAGGRGPVLRRLGAVALGGLAAVAVVTPWIAFNQSRFDAPVYLSTNAGGTLAAANCDSTYGGPLLGYKDYGCATTLYAAVAAREPDWGELDIAQQDQLIRREVSQYIADHRGRLPVVVAARVGRVLKLYGVGHELAYDQNIHSLEGWAVRAGLYSWYVAAGTAVAGAVVLGRRRDRALLPLLAIPLVTLTSVAMTFGQTRYRAPLEPAVVLLAAVAVDALVAAVAARRRGTPAVDAVPDAPAPGEATPAPVDQPV